MSAETEIPKGSYAAGRRVKLPAGAQPPFVVFVNGVEQARARLRGRAGEIVFSRRSSRRGSAPGAGWRCTWGSSAPTARTRRSTSSSSARAGPSCSPTCRWRGLRCRSASSSSPTTASRSTASSTWSAAAGTCCAAGAAARVGLPHRPRPRRRLGRDQHPPRAARQPPRPRRGELGEGLSAEFEAGGRRDASRPGAAPGDVDRHQRHLHHLGPARRRRPADGEEIGRARFTSRRPAPERPSDAS